MTPQDFMYHLENLQALDPDQLVADLGLTTQQILDAFTQEAVDFIAKEFG
jgi:hypothetical protein